MPNAATDTFGASRVEPAIAPDLAVEDTVPCAASLTIAKGTVLGQITASGLFKAYASGNGDGSQTAKVVAMYDFTTDGSGNVFLAHEKSVARKVAPVWIGGYFRTEDLVGLDATAVSGLGRLVKGDATTGLLKIN